MITFGWITPKLVRKAPPTDREARKQAGMDHAREIAHLRTARAFAVAQPKLCAAMPHRWFPSGKGHALCIRCGLRGREVA